VPRFVGSAEHAIDEKGRLVVPARFRERLGAEFVLTIAQPDPCLEPRRLAIGARADRVRAHPIGQHRSAHTEEVACDGQGRLLIPPALRAYAGIERECLSIGSLTRVEIWAKERLGAMRPADDEAEAFATDLGLY
jgi:MraZ protein